MKTRILAFAFIQVVFLLSMATAQGETISCNSCSDCSSKLNSAQAGDIVELTADIICDSGTSCVDFGDASQVTFDGGGHTISHGEGGSRGIYKGSDAGDGNTIENVEIRGFSRGIYLVRGAGSTIENCTFIGNNTGVVLYSSSTNIIDNSTFRQNFTGISVLYDSDDNVIRNSFIAQNYKSGISFFPRTGVGDPENNQIYNNVLSNTADGNITFSSILSDEDRDLSGIPFVLNTSLDCDSDANIMGCGCMGGNYWGLPMDQGFSQSCTDSDGNGICDEPYTVPHASAVLVDEYPLSVPAAGCCANSDRDGDTFAASVCGGTDHDDDPLGCGEDCYPGAPEICDGYDNDNDGLADKTIACQDKIIYKHGELPDAVSDQSCVIVPSTQKIYCFGGRTYGGSWYLDTIVEYDPVADHVEQLAAKMPTVRRDVACSWSPITERIYCFGGYSQITICDEYNEDGGCIAAHAVVSRYNDILEFNPADNSLNTLSLTLPASMDSMGIAWSDVNSSIFLFGGTSSVHSGDRDSILEFDPVAQTIETRSSVLPSARYGTSCAPDSSTGKIYCFGGYDEDGSIEDIVEFDPATDTLLAMTSTFSDGVYAPCVEDSVDNVFYCMAGRLGYANQDRIMMFNPRTDTLAQQEAKFLMARHGHACVENPATNKIYCLGGSFNVVCRFEIAEYTPYLPIIGDVDDNGSVSLSDLIQTLQLDVGFTPEGMNRKADISGNRQLGGEESAYILKKNAGF